MVLLGHQNRGYELEIQLRECGGMRWIHNLDKKLPVRKWEIDIWSEINMLQGHELVQDCLMSVFALFSVAVKYVVQRKAVCSA